MGGVRTSLKSSRALFPFQIKIKAILNCGLGAGKSPINPLTKLIFGAMEENAFRSQQEENCMGYLETFQVGKQMMVERGGGKLLQEEKSNDLITNLKAFCRRYWSRLYFLLQLRRVLITGR
jgi:hypothetical protein